MWNIPIIDGPVPWVLYLLSIALVVYLLVRPLTPAWLLTAGIGILGGAVIGLAAYLIATGSGAFGGPLPLPVCWWAMGALAAIGLAIVNLWNSRWWRKMVAALGIVVFSVTGVVGVNAYYGLNPTLGSLFGVVDDNPIVVPTPGPTGTALANPLYQSWKPPAGMPSAGTQGTQVIPATASGFPARPAGIYLPPAALVKDPPALPLVIMMMGYPGNPDPSFIGDTLDQFAAKNNGLAPIVIVADQIGTGGDPACADSKAYGNAETYITKDVVDWANANLNIIRDPKYWVIAGYSNGGGCAIKYMAKDPQQWKNLIDISGEEFPGSEDVASVVATIYGGDQAAFEASKPISILQANPGAYDGITAVFTVGSADAEFLPAAQTVSAAAKAAGMTTTYYEVPGAGHVGDALTGGLAEGFAVLYPVLGLSAP